MTLQRRLALRYGVVVAVCLVLLAALIYHEFVAEPEMFRRLGLQKPEGSEFAEFAEVVIYGAVPLIFGLGWWFVRKSLAPIDTLARSVEAFHAGSLRAHLPRSYNGDEVDRLAESFSRMAGRLDDAFQQIRGFTLHASHELKTPLTVMQAQLDTVLNDPEPLPPAQREWMNHQREEVRRLARIVDTLALLAKADAGLLTLEQQPVRLDELLREGYEDARILAEEQRIRVTLLGCHPCTILGDRDRLRQLLLNLTDNAVKYNYPGGAITLELRPSDTVAELTLANTGDRIPTELQARAFGRFVRGDTARTRSIEGSGLGLAICQWIVHGHRGTIEIATATDGLTAVRIRLPVVKPG